MTNNITNLESIIETISLLFKRARSHGYTDVPAPDNMHFGDNNSILLSWNLTRSPIDEAAKSFVSIREFSQTEFTREIRDDINVAIFTGNISWHGQYPDVNFKIFMPIEAA